MNWKPIEEYDALAKKPKNQCAFYFEAYGSGKTKLPPTIELTRNCGYRKAVFLDRATARSNSGENWR